MFFTILLETQLPPLWSDPKMNHSLRFRVKEAKMYINMRDLSQ